MITDDQIREFLAEVLARSPRFNDDWWLIRDCEIALGTNGWRHGVDCRIPHGLEAKYIRDARARITKTLAKETK
jgi:hypothetical protein